MKDHDKATDAEGVQSPIFAHPQFEHLEAEGAARGHAVALRKALSYPQPPQGHPKAC